jgi:hypothetical protein
MALASAVTGTIRSEEPRFFVPVTIAFPNPYTVGGEALALTDHVPAGATLINSMGDCNDLYTFRFDRTNEKVLAFVNATGAEAGAIDLSGQTGIVITFVCY